MHSIETHRKGDGYSSYWLQSTRCHSLFSSIIFVLKSHDFSAIADGNMKQILGVIFLIMQKNKYDKEPEDGIQI